MPLVLAKEPFDESKLPLLADFHCGDEFWARCAEEWIKAPVSADLGALFSMRK